MLQNKNVKSVIQLLNGNVKIMWFVNSDLYIVYVFVCLVFFSDMIDYWI